MYFCLLDLPVDSIHWRCSRQSWKRSALRLDRDGQMLPAWLHYYSYCLKLRLINQDTFKSDAKLFKNCDWFKCCTPTFHSLAMSGLRFLLFLACFNKAKSIIKVVLSMQKTEFVWCNLWNALPPPLHRGEGKVSKDGRCRQVLRCAICCRFPQLVLEERSQESHWILCLQLRGHVQNLGIDAALPAWHKPLFRMR